MLSLLDVGEFYCEPGQDREVAAAVDIIRVMSSATRAMIQDQQFLSSLKFVHAILTQTSNTMEFDVTYHPINPTEIISYLFDPLNLEKAVKNACEKARSLNVQGFLLVKSS